MEQASHLPVVVKEDPVNVLEDPAKVMEDPVKFMEEVIKSDVTVVSHKEVSIDKEDSKLLVEDDVKQAELSPILREHVFQDIS
jgi:hypothetical protein